MGYESWLERDHAMSLDFVPDVVAFAAQPFWLFLRVENKLRYRRWIGCWPRSPSGASWSPERAGAG